MQLHKANREKNSIISNTYTKKLGYYLPIIFIISILPLITYGKVIVLPIEEANFWKGGTTHVDFFNYYKSIFLIISTIALLSAYGGLYLNNKLPIQKEKRYYYAMFIYVLLSIISTVFSEYKHVALFGFIEMNQGIFVLVSYIVILFIMINYIRNEKDIKVIIYSFCFIVFIEGLLGLSQYFGVDFLQTSLGMKLITPNILKDTALHFKFGEHTIYATMYNTNFVGSFASLVLPITFYLFLFQEGRTRLIIYYIIAMFAFSLWIGCNSRAGYMGILASFIIGTIIYRKLLFKKYKKVIILFVGFLSILLLFNSVSNGRVIKQFSRLNIYDEVKNIEDLNKQDSVIFEDVSIDGNSFRIKTNYETLIGTVENSKINFKDEMGNKLGVMIDEFNNITFTDKKYSEYIFTLISAQINATIYGRPLNLQIRPDQELRVISYNNKLTYPINAPKLKLFDGKETFASNRGYIWSRTIPMLKNTLLIGYGPDNYAMFFPQEDYVGRFNVGNKGMTNIIIDKPHNMYLQVAINTGVLSLIALMFIWTIYLIDSFRIYSKIEAISITEYTGSAILLSIIGYLVAGLFNDNIVSVAPLFWVLLGTGIGINNIIRAQLNLTNNKRYSAL